MMFFRETKRIRTAQAQKTGDWENVADLLTNAAMLLETAGAELLFIGANTMHRVADTLQTRVGIPLIHIADAVGDAICDAGLQQVGLLGTRATMEQDFYARKLADRGLQTNATGRPARVPGSVDLR